MKIETVKIAKINPAPYNPRKDLVPSDPEYQKLKKSIDKFGFVEPLVWNVRSGNLVGGHQRLKILIEEGAMEAEVSVVDLNDADEKTLNINLNKTGGDWDQETLSSLLSELSKIPDFDMELTGFEKYELNALDVDVDFSSNDDEESVYDKETENTLNINYDADGDEEQNIQPDPQKEPVKQSNAKKHEAKRPVDPDSYDVYSIAFSGGKDSTLLALWALERIPPEKIYLKYWDSGWNFEEETKYVYYFAEKYGLNLIMSGYKNNEEVLKNMRERGYPFYGNLWCQSQMKVKSLKTVHRYMLDNISDNILSLVGIRKSESKKRADYPEFSRQSGETLWFPIRDYTDDDLIEYFKNNGEKITPLYKFTDRTGCVFCPNANVSTREFIKHHRVEEYIKINECIVEALKDKRWASTHLIDTIKLYNRKRAFEPKDYFKDIAFSDEEFAAIKINPDKVNVIDLRE